jgi:hypothetical protein
VVAVTDWNHRESAPVQTSVLRVLDVSAADAPVVRQDVELPGFILDVQAVDNAFHVLREDVGAGSRPGAARVLLTSFQLTGALLRERASVAVPGEVGSLAVGATKNVLARRVPAKPPLLFASELSIVDIDADPTGAFAVRGSVRLGGAIPVGLQPSLDDEGRFVRALTCASRECAGQEAPVLSVVDTSNQDMPVRVAGLALPAGHGAPVVAFDGDRAYVSGDRGYRHADGTTDVHVVDLGNPARPRVSAALAVRASVSNFVPIGERVLAVGSHGAPTTGIHVILHEIDVSRADRPALVGTMEFGEDWTSTRAAETSQALAIEEREGLLALPFSTWNERLRRYADGVELVHRTGRGPVGAHAALSAGWTERVVFLKERLVAVTDRGLTVIDPDSPPSRCEWCE